VNAVDARYAEEVADLLAPKAIEELQRAAQLLDQALPLVREAMGYLEPIHQGQRAAVLRAVAGGGSCPDDIYDALRDLSAFGRAIDLALDVLNEVSVVA
jgi:hypothetical protein